MRQVDLAEKLDVTPRQIRKLVRRGMPTHTVRAAEKWRSAKLDISQTKSMRMNGNNGKNGKNGSKKRGAKEELKTIDKKIGKDKEKSGEQIEIDLSSVDADVLFTRARAVKEKALAQQAEAETALFTGTLVTKEDVNRGVATAARQLRDHLVNLSRRIAPELLEQKSVAKLEKLLAAEIRTVLESASLKMKAQGEQSR